MKSTGLIVAKTIYTKKTSVDVNISRIYDDNNIKNFIIY